MKITIGCSGDHSVGIHGASTVIDLACELDDEVREHYREQFRSLFAELWDDGSTWVLFEDERFDGPWDEVVRVTPVVHRPEQWGPSDNRRLTCSCGNPDPAHMDNN